MADNPILDFSSIDLPTSTGVTDTSTGDLLGVAAEGINAAGDLIRGRRDQLLLDQLGSEPDVIGEPRQWDYNNVPTELMGAVTDFEKIWRRFEQNRIGSDAAALHKQAVLTSWIKRYPNRATELTRIANSVMGDGPTGAGGVDSLQTPENDPMKEIVKQAIEDGMDTSDVYSDPAGFYARYVQRRGERQKVADAKMQLDLLQTQGSLADIRFRQGASLGQSLRDSQEAGEDTPDTQFARAVDTVLNASVVDMYEQMSARAMEARSAALAPGERVTDRETAIQTDMRLTLEGMKGLVQQAYVAAGGVRALTDDEIAQYSPMVGIMEAALEQGSRWDVLNMGDLQRYHDILQNQADNNRNAWELAHGDVSRNAQIVSQLGMVREKLGPVIGVEFDRFAREVTQKLIDIEAAAQRAEGSGVQFTPRPSTLPANPKTASKTTQALIEGAAEMVERSPRPEDAQGGYRILATQAATWDDPTNPRPSKDHRIAFLDALANPKTAAVAAASNTSEDGRLMVAEMAVKQGVFLYPMTPPPAATSAKYVPGTGFMWVDRNNQTIPMFRGNSQQDWGKVVQAAAHAEGHTRYEETAKDIAAYLLERR